MEENYQKGIVFKLNEKSNDYYLILENVKWSFNWMAIIYPLILLYMFLLMKGMYQCHTELLMLFLLLPSMQEWMYRKILFLFDLTENISFLYWMEYIQRSLLFLVNELLNVRSVLELRDIIAILIVWVVCFLSEDNRISRNQSVINDSVLHMYSKSGLSAWIPGWIYINDSYGPPVQIIVWFQTKINRQTKTDVHEKNEPLWLVFN